MGKEDEEENLEESVASDTEQSDEQATKQTVTRKVKKTGLQKDIEDIPKIKVILAIMAGATVTAAALFYSTNLLKTCYAIIMGIVVFYILGMFIEGMIIKHIRAHYAALEAEQERIREQELAQKQEEERLLLLERANQLNLEAAELRDKQEQENLAEFEDEEIADAIKQAIS